MNLLEVAVVDQRHIRRFYSPAVTGTVTESPERFRARVVGHSGLECAVVTEIVIDAARSRAVVALDLRAVIVHGHRPVRRHRWWNVMIDVTVTIG